MLQICIYSSTTKLFCFPLDTHEQRLDHSKTGQGAPSDPIFPWRWRRRTLFLLCCYTSTLLEAITSPWLDFANKNRIKHFSSAFLTHSSFYRTLPEKSVSSANSSFPSHPWLRANTRQQKHQHDFARSELCLCRLYHVLTQNKASKEWGKKVKKEEEKKSNHTPPTCYGFQTLAHISIQKYEKSHREGRAGKYYFPWFLKIKVPSACWSFLRDYMPSSCACHQQTKLPGPCISPGLRTEGASPHPQEGHCPLTIILPLCFLQDIQSDQHTEHAACPGCKQKTSIFLLRNRNRNSCSNPNPSFKEILMLLPWRANGAVWAPKVLWITLWEQHKIRKRKWLDQSECYFSWEGKRTLLSVH